MADIVERLRGEKYHTLDAHLPLLREAADEITRLREEVERLVNWINDLHSGMYINCVYCGYRYGPKHDTPVAMSQVLREHIEQCPEHPVSKLKHRLVYACEQLKHIVCTEGEDAGVILLDHEGSTHPKEINGRTVQVYDHDYFSPLGDALIHLYETLHSQKDGDV